MYGYVSASVSIEAGAGGGGTGGGVFTCFVWSVDQPGVSSPLLDSMSLGQCNSRSRIISARAAAIGTIMSPRLRFVCDPNDRSLLPH